MRVMAGSSRCIRQVSAFTAAVLMVAGVGLGGAQTPQAPQQVPPPDPQQAQPQQEQPLPQQEPQQPQTPPAGIQFTGQAGVVFNQIKPDRTADFEYVIGRLKEAMAQTDDPTRRRQAEGWRIYRAKEPAGEGAILYLFLIDPVVPEADYTASGILKLLYEVFPSEGQELYQKFTESFTGSRNMLNLDLIAALGGQMRSVD
jgi:hypothetical protein